MMVKRMDFTELNKTPPTIRFDSIIGGSPSAAAAIREHHNRTYSVTQNSVVFSRASSTDLPHSQTCPALPQRLRCRLRRRPKNLLTPPHPDFRKLLPWQEVTWTTSRNLCQLSDRNEIHLDSPLKHGICSAKSVNLLRFLSPERNEARGPCVESSWVSGVRTACDVIAD